MDDDSLAQGPSFVQRTLSSLRWRNFRLFFIGQTISQTGNWLTNVALTLLILHRTGSGVALGLLVACQYGPILLLSAWAGVIVDRTSKRNLLYVTQALEMCESLALAALAFMHNAPLAAFYVIAVAGGTLLALDNPVPGVRQRDGADRRDTQRRDALQRHEQHGSHRGTRHRRPAHRDGRLRVVLHGGNGTYTLVYSAFSAGGLVGALLVARRSTVSIRTVAVGAAGLGAAMLVLSAVPSVALAFLVATLVGAASVAYMTATTSIAQLRTEPHMIGRVLALQTVLLVGTAPIGGPILGAIADAVGVRAPVLIGGVAALAAAAFGVLAARRVDARRGYG